MKLEKFSADRRKVFLLSPVCEVPIERISAHYQGKTSLVSGDRPWHTACRPPHGGAFRLLPTFCRPMLNSFGFVGKSFGLPAGDRFSRSDSSVDARSIDHVRERDQTFATVDREADFEENLRGVEAASTTMAPPRDSRDSDFTETRSEPGEQESIEIRKEGDHQTSTNGSVGQGPRSELSWSSKPMSGQLPDMFEMPSSGPPNKGTQEPPGNGVTAGTTAGLPALKPPNVGESADPVGSGSQSGPLPSNGRPCRKPPSAASVQAAVPTPQATDLNPLGAICCIATPIGNSASAVNGTAEIGPPGTPGLGTLQSNGTDVPVNSRESHGDVSLRQGRAAQSDVGRTPLSNGSVGQAAESIPADSDAAEPIPLLASPGLNAAARAQASEGAVGDAQRSLAPDRLVGQSPVPDAMSRSVMAPTQVEFKTQVADGRTTIELRPDAHDGSVVFDESFFRQSAVTSSESVAQRLSETGTSDPFRERQNSDFNLQNVAGDAFPGATAVNDKAIGSVSHTPGRLESAPQGSIAEQILGEVAERVEATHRDGKIDFRMRLDPPGLGTVHVQLIATDRSVSAQLIANDESARQALEGQWHTLRDSLARLGVTLQHSAVGRDGRGGSSGNWQGQQRESPPAPQSEGLLRFLRPGGGRVSRPTSGGIDVVV